MARPRILDESGVFGFRAGLRLAVSGPLWGGSWVSGFGLKGFWTGHLSFIVTVNAEVRCLVEADVSFQDPSRFVLPHLILLNQSI